MTSVPGDFAQLRVAEAETVPWIAVLLGLVALYVPIYAELAQGAWREEAHAHGPIVLAVFLWLVWRKRAALRVPTQPALLPGALVLAAGLVLYLAGRALSIVALETASHLPVVAGSVLLIRGRAGLRLLAMPILFLFFLIPLPSFVLDAITAPLKEVVSFAVEALLALAGYEVEREGVVLAVRGHELLVADACSGLNSIYSLFAMALIYTQLVGERTRARIATLLLAVVPIAIAVNILRVTFLALVTVHLGEEAASGNVHLLAGLAAFALAIVLLTSLDAHLRPVVSPKRPRMEWKVRTATAWMPAFARVKSHTVLAAGFALTFAMIGAAIAVPVLKPRTVAAVAPDFDALIPTRFGEWRIDPRLTQIPPAADASLERVYDQIVARTYVNPQGERIMLLLAYGGVQSDALKAHRQEGCYASQGFEIRDLHTARLDLAGREIPVTRMQAVRGTRSEPVTYWFTMGDRVVMSRLERLRMQVSEGWAGRVPDGTLVRVSSLSTDPARAYDAQRQFLAAALAAVPAEQRWRLVGAPTVS